MTSSTRGSLIPHVLLVTLVAAAFGAASLGGAALPLPDAEREFNSPGFIVRHAWVKFAFLATQPLRDDLSRDEEDARIARYYALNRAIAEAEQRAGDPAAAGADADVARSTAAALREDRADIENSVEVILEGRLTHIVKEAGLTRDLGHGVVWPPVNVEFQDPPSVLVTSPRREIVRQSDDLLQSDLTIDEVQRIEAGAEADGATSALVVRIGGVAMYPAIVPQRGDYAASMEDIAHEWMHHYLAFTPLGRVYFSGGEQTTLNETLANIAARELSNAMVAAYPLVEAATRTQSRQQQTGIDFTAEMRGLRRDVEAMLAAGRIEAAEALMEEKRRFLAENGYYIRRLNQAYFAFHGSYADSPGSIDPIGPALQQLRDESASLEAFVETARGFTQAEDLEAALAR